MRRAERLDLRIEPGVVEELAQRFIKPVTTATRGGQQQVRLLLRPSAHCHQRSRSQPPPGSGPSGAIFTSACSAIICYLASDVAPDGDDDDLVCGDTE